MANKKPAKKKSRKMTRKATGKKSQKSKKKSTKKRAGNPPENPDFLTRYVDAIAPALKNPDVGIKIEALEDLASLQKNGVDITPAIKMLAELLADDDQKVRWATVDILTEIRNKRYPWQYSNYSKAIKILRSDPRYKKIEACEWLIQITVPDLVSDRDERSIEFAIPTLAAAIWDDPEKVAQFAIQAIQASLSEDDVEDALPAIVKVFNLPDEAKYHRTKTAAAKFLKYYASERGTKAELKAFLPALEPHLTDAFEPVKLGVADALTYFHACQGRWAQVRAFLSHKDKDVRQEAAGTLAQGYSLNLENILPDLRAIVSDAAEDPDVRLVAARSLAKGSNTPEELLPVIPVTIDALSHENPENRKYAAGIFYSIFDKFKYAQGKKRATKSVQTIWKPITEILPQLEAALKDQEPKIQESIASLLVMYYLRLELPEKIIAMLENVPSSTKPSILKRIEYEKWPLPPILEDFLKGRDVSKLGKKLIQLAKSGKKEVSLSAQAIGKVKIRKLPKEIGLLTQITKLDLGNNSLTELPPEIGALENLRYFVLSQNQLTTLPPEFGNLKSLENLFLYRNPLKVLPPEFGNLKNLTYLQLIQTDLQTFPPEFGNCSNLKHLEAKENEISSLPVEFCNLQSLSSLNLSRNKLTLEDFPSCMKNLENLTQLMINGMKLGGIPEFVYGLPNLEYLEFGGNGVTEISPEIANLKTLKNLYLYDNDLKTLPPEIGQLTNLEYLQLENNPLESLPRELLNLKNLHYLTLERTNLGLPAGITRRWQHPDEILKAYFGKN